jgi:hypothetical protein
MLSHSEISTFFDNTNQPDKSVKDYERLWKISSCFDKLNDTYAKFYNPF